jgi:hypothetical protein
MIKQVLLFKFKALAELNQIESFFSAWKFFEANPGIQSIEFGKNVSTEGDDKGYSHAAIVTFDSEIARDEFLVSSKHVELCNTYLYPILEDIIIVDFLV